jgi:hypothetical protein
VENLKRIVCHESLGIPLQRSSYEQRLTTVSKCFDRFFASNSAKIDHFYRIFRFLKDMIFSINLWGYLLQTFVLVEVNATLSSLDVVDDGVV